MLPSTFACGQAAAQQPAAATNSGRLAEVERKKLEKEIKKFDVQAPSVRARR